MAIKKNKQPLPIPAEHNPLRYPPEDDCFINCSTVFTKLEGEETPIDNSTTQGTTGFLPALKLIPSNSNLSSNQTTTQ